MHDVPMYREILFIPSNLEEALNENKSTKIVQYLTKTAKIHFITFIISNVI